MSASEDLWRTPAAGRPEPPYGGFYPNANSGYLPAPAPVAAAPAVDVKGEAATGLIVLLVCLFLGTPVGLIWAALRPHFDINVISAAEESAIKPQFTADMTLAGLGLAAGAIAGIAAWALVRRHGTGAVIGLAIGGYLAMEVAAHVGKLAAHPENLRAVLESQLPSGEVLSSNAPQTINLLSFQLRSPGVLLAFSIGALLLFGVLTAIRDRSAPKPYRLSFAGASSGSAAVGSAPAPVPPSGS